MARKKTISARQRKQLKGLATFLPIFTDPKFSCGTWQGCVQIGKGHWMLPFFTFST
jgi:hypothetical protein